MGVIAGAAFRIIQTENEFLGFGIARGLTHSAFIRIRSAVKQIIADRAVQQRGVLCHHADLPTQRFLGHLADVLAIDVDAACWGLVKSKKQIDDG